MRPTYVGESDGLLCCSSGLYILCVLVYVCVLVSACMHACAHVCMCVHVCVCVSERISLCV